MSDEMKAGPELDAAIAEELMGWKRLPDRKPPDSPGFAVSFMNLKRWMMPSGATTSDVPEYSASIAAAWEVVEKLQADGFRWQFQSRNPLMSDLDLKPWVRFWHYTKGVLDIDANAEADTATLAICIAAREAVRKK